MNGSQVPTRSTRISPRVRLRIAIAIGLVALAVGVALFGSTEYATVTMIVAGIYLLKAFLPW